MKTLSYTQEFYLCAINRNGDVPELNAHISSCWVVGEILELLHYGYIDRDKKDYLTVRKAWDNKYPYLKPIYDAIADQKKTNDIKSIAEIFLYNDKQLKTLYAALGASMADDGYTEEVIKKGLIKTTRKYVPKKDAVEQLKEKIQAEFSESSALTEDTICLVTMLDKSALIPRVFNKEQAEVIEEHIKEVRSSEVCISVKKLLDYLDAVLISTLIVMM